jgi:hypothetical protein
MMMRTLFVVSVGVLLVPGMASPTEQAPTSRSVDLTPSATRQNAVPSGGTLRTVIYELRYYNCVELADLLRNVTGEEGANAIVADERSNRLIVTASPERMREIERLIQQLDTRGVRGPQVQSLMYRVYMLELPSKDQSLKPFSVLLERSSQLSPVQFMDAIKDGGLQIATWLQNSDWIGDDKWGLVIEGRAASNDVLKQMLAKMPDSQVRELKWDDETFTSALPAAQVSRLPSPLQDYVRKFLGDEAQTVGYWFGSLSVPGEVKAPIGPWMMEIKTQSEQGADLVLEVRVSRESPIPFVREAQLLSNTVQGRVGRPIIIGYNRESYGTRVMGAMVILLEADTTAPVTVEAEKK